MDRLTALVAIAHLKLRLELLGRNPDLLEAIDMTRTIKRPIELAGFAGRLNRAEKLETELAVTGERYDTVLADIDDQHIALKGHVGSLEVTRAALDQVINRMTASNGGPNDGSSEPGSLVGQGSSMGSGQVIDGKPVA